MYYVGVTPPPPDMKAKVLVAGTQEIKYTDKILHSWQETEGVKEVASFKNQLRKVDSENLVSEECKNGHLCNA